MTKVNVHVVASLPSVKSTINSAHHDFQGGYEWTNTYSSDKGILQIAVAGPTDSPCKFVRTHGGKGRRVLSWVAVRWGALPILPEPAPSDQNETLLDVEISPANPIIMPDGYRHALLVSGVYVYGQKIATKIDQGLRFGIGPNDDASSSAFVLQKPNFKDYFK